MTHRSNESFRSLTNDELEKLNQKLQDFLNDFGFEVHPFKVKWYNELVQEEFRLKYHENTLVYVVLSVPCMFEKSFLPYLAFTHETSGFDSENVLTDSIDKCMQYYFALFKKKISLIASSQVDKIHDFELVMPYRRPRILLQTAAHISGAAYYYKNVEKNHRLGVCIHPEYGGWFGIRGVFILNQLLIPNKKLKLPRNVVVPESQQKLLLELFNNNWLDCAYRDIIPVKDRYSDLQIEYFTLRPKDRINFINQTIVPLLFLYKRSNISF